MIDVEREYTTLTLNALRALAGRQVTSASELYRVICGESPPGDVPPIIIDLMAQLLRELGYVERWVRRADEAGRPPAFLWVRDPWRIDHPANLGKRVPVYLPFY